MEQGEINRVAVSQGDSYYGRVVVNFCEFRNANHPFSNIGQKKLSILVVVVVSAHIALPKHWVKHIPILWCKLFYQW